MVGTAQNVTKPQAGDAMVLDTTTKPIAVHISGLKKSYGAIKAVQDLSLDIFKGEVFALLGPNGAGKTTTIEILEGYRIRDGGAVSVLGYDPQKHSELAALKERMGVMLQQSSIYQIIRVGEAINLFASYYNNPADTNDLLKLVGLQDHVRSSFKDLSGGQKQRMGLALALVGNPDIVFLDEPTASMDPQARIQTWDIITRLKERGVTVLLTTHYMEEAQRLADRVAIIDHGSLVALDTPDALAQHLGSDEISFRANPGISLAALGALDGATSASESQPGHYSIVAENTDRLIMSLMLWANGAGIQPTDIKIERANLEDVFLKLTGEEVRD
ncbi:MAG: ABC transporter ATP-binding protein [Chloroflexia bacterium]